jgi:hypothetical protein
MTANGDNFINDNLQKIIFDNFSRINKWIDNTLERYKYDSRPVKDFCFKRLQFYFQEGLLSSSRVVLVKDNPPMPLELFTNEFKLFENYFKGAIAAITYRNTYFVLENFANDESLHFHELIHVIQWNHFGYERMLYLYALGLLESGYRDSFLEDIAYRHQARFDSGDAPYDAEVEVIAELKKYEKGKNFKYKL